MAESSVSFLIEKIGILFENEVNLLGGVGEEVVWLRGELERVKAFLRVADALQETDDELSVWVRQVRDIAHETEDLLAEYTLLQGHSHEPGVRGTLRKWACCIKKGKAFHRIANDLKSINARVRAVGKAHKRLREKFTRAEQGLSLVGAAGRWQDCRDDALLLDESDLVGIDGQKKQLVEWLISGDSGREVFSVTGQGGMGKTTLAKQVYDDEAVKKHFNVRAWVSVSQSFEIEDVLRDLVEQLFRATRRKVPSAVQNMTNNRLKSTIKEMLQRQRYLIVMDDVWQLHAWGAIQCALPKNNIGSRVMITTRNADVAKTASNESKGSKAYNLEPLPPSESWDLFCKKTFQGNACPIHLVEICKKILKKCEGLPLAIVAISGVLATKDTRRIDEWDMVARSIGAEIDGNDKLKDLKKVLSLSFDDLPYYLKSCFMYLSIFPEDHLIERMRLIRLWIAEGFIEEKEGKVLEEVADDYLKDLMNRSLVQVATTTSDGRVKTFRIHDLLREIITSKSRDQNFATIVKDQKVQFTDRPRRLSVHYTLEHLQPHRSVYQLRSLFMFEILEKLRLHILFPNGFRLLIVFDMQNSLMKKIPSQIVGLYNLKYLSLRDTKVKVVPRFVGKLHNLETLDLKHTQVTELPVEILNLKKLRHLLVYQTEYKCNELFDSKHGFKITGNIGVLQSLQKLCFIEANQESINVVKELGNLNGLRRLGILKLRREDGRELCLSIEKLTNLRALSISSTEEDDIIDLQYLSAPPVLLQRLYMRGRLEMLPHWIPSLHGLVKLSLKWSKLKEDPLVYLQHIPNLVHLVMCQVYTGQRLHFRASGFRKLKILGLDEFDKLRCIEVEEGAMPLLEDLSVRRCQLLGQVPLGIEHLRKLKLLEICDMPDNFLGTLHPEAIDGEHWRVAHIPEVYATYWRDGELKIYSLESLSHGENCPLPIKTHDLDLHDRWK